MENELFNKKEKKEVKSNADFYLSRKETDLEIFMIMQLIIQL